VKNIISFVLAAVSAGLKGVVVAKGNQREVNALVRLGGDRLSGVQVMAFSELRDVLGWMAGERISRLPLASEEASAWEGTPSGFIPNFDDMILTPELSKVALVVATGLHSLLLYGAPGCG